MRSVWLALGLIASPLAADPLGIVDWDAVIAANATQIVVQSDGAERVTVDGVTILRQPNGAVSTSDSSSEGAVGCYASILVVIVSAHQRCPGFLTDAESQQIGLLTDQLLTFYHDNVGRDVTAGTVRAAFERAVAAEPFHAQTCKSPSIAHFANMIAGDPASVETFGDFLTLPRLPAMNPCF